MNTTELIERVDMIEKELHAIVQKVPNDEDDYLSETLHEDYRQEVLPWIDSLKRRIAECQK